MQIVYVYDNVYRAAEEMRSLIAKGWRVHTCTMGQKDLSYGKDFTLLVIYEMPE